MTRVAEVGMRRRRHAGGTLRPTALTAGLSLLLAASALCASCGKPASSGTDSRSRRSATLTVAVNAGPNESLDAVKPVDDLDQVRAQLVYEKMAEVDRDFRVTPILYTSATHNADGTRWTFQLDPKATFANGEPVEGSDVLATLKAAAGQDSVQELAMINLKRSTASGKTIRFVLDQATADLPFKFATSFFVVLPDGKGSTNPATMNGSGPYQVSTFVPGQRTVLTRRPGYWGADRRGRSGRIVLLGVADPAARMRALLAHQVDMAVRINLSDAKSNARNKAIVMHESPAPEGMDLILNAKMAPFDDVRVRQAFRLAVNRTELASVALSGVGRPGNDVWGAGFPGYTTRLPQRTQNIAEARKLLAEAGHPRVSLAVYAPQGGGPLTQGTLLIAQQVKAAGFDVTVKQVSAAQYNQGKEWTRWPAVAFALGLPFQSMADFFYRPGSSFNFGWNDPKWTATFDRALGTFDRARAQRLLDGLQEQLWQRGPDVIWGVAPTVIATTPAVTGLDRTTNFSYPGLAGVTVTK